MTPLRPQQAYALLLAILIAGTVLRVWGLWFGLPHPMVRPDEEVLVRFSLQFFSGDLNPHFFEWPSLAFYVVYGLIRAAYYLGRLTGTYPDIHAFWLSVNADPTWIFKMIRVISASCGVLTLIVVYRLAARLFDLTTALIATGLLAIAFLHVRDSHFGVLDVPLTLLVVATISILVTIWQREPSTMHLFVLAGACAGFATSLKYNGSALLVAAAVTAALKVLASPSRRWLPPALGFVLFCATFVICFVLGTPYAVLDATTFREGLVAQSGRLSEGHGLRISQAWVHHLNFSLRHGLGPSLLVVAIAGILAMWIRDWRKAALLCAFPLAYFTIIGSGHTAFVRYTTPLVPFLCISAAFTIREAARLLPSNWSDGVRATATALATVLLSWPSVMSSVHFDRILAQRDTRLLAADWLAANIKPTDRLYESGWIYAQPHFAWLPGRVQYVPVMFERSRDTWIAPTGDAVKPEWIVVAESPLRLYTPVTPQLRSEVASGYRLVQKFSGSPVPEREAWFDRQDAFFIPFAHLSERERPGPDLSIYRRIEP